MPNLSNSRISLAIALMAAACSQSRDASTPQVVATHTEIVRFDSVPQSRITTGTVRSATVSPLASRVVGNVTRVLVSEGDPVRAGQLLIEIDDRDSRARSEQARAAAGGIEEAIHAADASIAAARANAGFADATYRRFAALRERGSVSPHEFDEVAARQKAAQAELTRAERGRDQLLAQRAQSAAAAREADTLLSYSRIRSPIDGVVASRFVDAGAQAAPGMPLLIVEDAHARRVETAVDERLAAEVRPGDAVTVEGMPAVVAHLAPVDPATRSALVKIDLPRGTPLLSGAFVHVGFAAGAEQRIMIPASAVSQRGPLTSVFVVDAQNAARMRLVTLGEVQGKRIEVLAGLDPGERIVIAAGAVRDGMQVRERS
jgi:RND family efflux transporter MFP subunit